jgi:hypothetical protein
MDHILVSTREAKVFKGILEQFGLRLIDGNVAAPYLFQELIYLFRINDNAPKKF